MKMKLKELLKKFFTKKYQKDKVKIRFGRIVLVIIVTFGLIKMVIQYKINITGRDLKIGSDTAYLNSIDKNSEEINKPNVIVMLVDDLGYGDLSCYGSTTIKTPNIDKLAEEGVAFNNFYSASPVCTPSRAGLLSGRYPARTHLPNVLRANPLQEFVLGNVMGKNSYGMKGISPDEILLPEVMKAEGYNTGMMGKWHLGDEAGYKPNDNGFDYFYGSLYSVGMKPFNLYKNEEIDVPDDKVDKSTLTKTLTNEAVNYIKNSKDEPFFLYYASPYPHHPEMASEDFINTSKAGLYGDCVQELDWSVGEIMNTLKEEGLDKNTLVVFTSDNGPWFMGDAGNARGRKGSNFDGGMKVPFIAWMPETIQKGVISDQLVSGMDLFPTVLDLVNVELPNDRIIDGISILPLLEGETQKIDREELFLMEGKNVDAVVLDDFKYFDKASSEMGHYWYDKQGPYLFDLKNDPREAHDVTPNYPDKANDLKSELEKFRTSLKDNLRGWK